MIKSAKQIVKQNQLWPNITQWFTGNQNRNVGGTVQPQNSQPYNVSAPISVPPSTQSSNNNQFNQLVRDVETLRQYVNTLSKDMKKSFDSWRPLYDTFNKTIAPWQYIRQQAAKDPLFVGRLNQQALQRAQAAMQRSLPLVAQMISEQKKDFVTSDSLFKSVNEAFQAINSLVYGRNEKGQFGGGYQYKPPAPVTPTSAPVTPTSTPAAPPVPAQTAKAGSAKSTLRIVRYA